MFCAGLLGEGVGEEDGEGGDIRRHTRQVKSAPRLSQPPEFVVHSCSSHVNRSLSIGPTRMRRTCGMSETR